jgi:Fe-S cluster biogenesis protein NfuA
MMFWRRGKGGDAIDERIRQALVELRASLPNHVVDIDLIAFERQSGVARVRVSGDCAECDMPLTLLQSAIEVRLRLSVPEIRSVLLLDETQDG